MALLSYRNIKQKEYPNTNPNTWGQYDNTVDGIAQLQEYRGVALANDQLTLKHINIQHTMLTYRFCEFSICAEE